MNRDWMEHQRQVREDRANGKGRDDREVYGRDELDEVHAPSVRRAREEAASDELQDRRAEYHMNPGQHDEAA